MKICSDDFACLDFSFLLTEHVELFQSEGKKKILNFGKVLVFYLVIFPLSASACGWDIEFCLLEEKRRKRKFCGSEMQLDCYYVVCM